MRYNKLLIFLMSMFLFVSITSYHLEAHAGIKKYIFGWIVWQGAKVGVKSCLKDPKCRKALKDGSIKRGSKLGQLAIKRYGPKVRKAGSKLAKWAMKKFSNINKVKENQAAGSTHQGSKPMQSAQADLGMQQLLSQPLVYPPHPDGNKPSLEILPIHTDTDETTGLLPGHVPDGTEAISSILPGQSIDPPNTDDFIIHSVLPNIQNASQDTKDRLQEVLGDAVPMGGGMSSTPNFEKPSGNIEDDFEMLTQGAASITPHGSTFGPSKTAILPDGTKITMRPGSTTDSRPTIEIRKPTRPGGKGKAVLEVRYGKK